jgi:glycosyltransferase involved in cell wall biosynthesis
MRPRKILYVTTDLFVGGAEGMLARMVTAEPRLADEITVVSLLPGAVHAARMRAAGATVIEMRFDRPDGIVAGLVQLARLIARTKPDIVQGWMYHGDLAALAALSLSGRRKDTRLVWGIRCSEIDLNRYSAGLRAVVRACALMSNRPDIVTANSIAGLQAHVRSGYRPRRSEIVYNGIDTDEFKPDAAARSSVRQELGLAQNAIVAAHVARVDPMKDHDGFLAAMTALPDMQALVIGADTERLGGGQNVHRLGQRHDVARLLSAADIVVSSSAFAEGFSNAVAEGMACGLPAVATDVGDAAIIVGSTGIIVPPRNSQALAGAIRTLAGEPAPIRAARGAQARERILKEFAMAKALERFASLYAGKNSAPELQRGPAKL